MATTVQGSATMEWDESRFNTALARLQEMHIQASTHLLPSLRKLRNTIPSLIEPMLEPHTSPESLYTTFSHAATTAGKDMRVFTDLMEDTETKTLLEKARSRRMESSEAILPWRVTQHAGWLHHDNAVRVGKDREEAMDPSIPDELSAEGEEKDPEVILEAFRHEHPTITADMDDEAKTIIIALPPPARMKFTLRFDLNFKEQRTFRISCSGTSNMHTAILRCLSTRPRQNDLRFLLEMIAAYSDIKTRACAACGKLLDGKPQIPVIRRKRESKDPGSNDGQTWDALHESCAQGGPSPSVQ